MDSEILQQQGDMLRQPLLPLVRLCALLFLATPEDDITSLVGSLTEPVDTGDVTYDNPAAILAPYIDLLADLAILKGRGQLPVTILDTSGTAIDPFEAVDLWVSHRILVRELEQINGRLCAPCNCTLCCTGPDGDHFFFEIPLSEKETDLFTGLPRIDSEKSRRTTAYDDPPLMVKDRPFYEHDPCLVRWRTGFGMILPRNGRCTHLDRDGRCAIYPQRPEVCRRPQIFSYLLEQDRENPDTFTTRRTLLAVWDCPYVRQMEDAIAEYGRLCGLEVLFRQNKA